MKCLVVGAGSVGTVLAAYLSKAGNEVICYARPERKADYEAAQGLLVQSVGDAPSVSVARPAISDRYDLDGIDVLLLCVKHPALPAVLEQLPATLPKGLVLVPCLNGVGLSPRLRERFPGTEVAQLTIMFNARVESPLNAILTTKPEVLFNTNNQQLLQMFDNSGIHMGRVDDAAEWGKLLINLNNAVCAATHTTFKDLLTNKTMTASFVAVLDEAIGLLEQTGIRYTLPVPVPYRLYRWVLLHGGPLAWWIARKKNGLTDQAFPSMVADLQNGRTTEIEQLNGEIVALGKKHGIATPANARLVGIIHEMEAGKQVTLTADQLRQALANAH